MTGEAALPAASRIRPSRTTTSGLAPLGPVSISPMATTVDNTTIPWDWYVDASVARLEQERIFRRTWQYVGHTGDLKEVGSFVATRALSLIHI